MAEVKDYKREANENGATAKDYMELFEEQVEETKEEKKEEFDEKNFDPSSFKDLEKEYKEEEKLLSKIDFENEQDKLVFECLPLTPSQKLEVIYSLILEDSKNITIDDDLKKSIKDLLSK
jgi:hypothetical protein